MGWTARQLTLTEIHHGNSMKKMRKGYLTGRHWPNEPLESFGTEFSGESKARRSRISLRVMLGFYQIFRGPFQANVNDCRGFG